LSSTTVAATEAPTTTLASADPNAAANPTTAPTTTTAATTTTALPSIGRYLAIGDSVMRGAASPLKAAGFTVDAVESRQFGDYLPQLQAIVNSGQLPEVVVVHLGTNGNINENDAREFFTLLKDVPKVIVLTVWVDKEWTEPNNELILSLPADFPNVQVGYWADMASHCVGNCYAASDGYHLSADGADYYAALIAEWAGI
jgi:lysophospholipase L1-like esterase